MGLSTPRVIFGVHSFTPYNRTTGLPYGIVKVLEGSSLAISSEFVELMGGAQKYAWAIEDGAFSAEMSVKVAEYPDFLIELCTGTAPTSNSAESSGAVSSLTNKKGTSCQSSTTGIASVSALSGSEADLKFGRYVVKVVSSTTVDVYTMSDIDFARGTDLSYQNDGLKITASALTVPSGSTVNIPNTGLKLTGGSGTIGMTTGDTATFEVRPINTKSMTVTVGASASQTLSEFGAIVMAQKLSTGEMFEIDCVRCKASGLPLGFDMNAFSKAELKVKVFYDSTQNKLLDIRNVVPA